MLDITGVGTIFYVLASFFLAAFTKGVIGLGFSTLCLPLLAIVLELTISIPLVIMPWDGFDTV
ncbi:MAG: hypothetical protein F6K42_23910 [Leptolyngbya sp. SIO1D8]|nr:hypothetical protein [Leptolyngbya sp. SIO1D8]